MGILDWLFGGSKAEPDAKDKQPTGTRQIQTVTFPPQEAPTLDGVNFPVIVDGEKRVCSVTVEALQDHCGLRDENYVGAFQANRGRIQIAVERLIRSGQFSEGDKIIIKSSDL